MEDKADTALLAIVTACIIIMLGCALAVFGGIYQGAINALNEPTPITTPAPNGNPLTIDDIQPAEGL